MIVQSYQASVLDALASTNSFIDGALIDCGIIVLFYVLAVAGAVYTVMNLEDGNKTKEEAE